MADVFPEDPALPHPALLQADWADRYVVISPEPAMPAIRAAQLALGQSPAWVRRLLDLRNRVVAPFGLKAAKMSSARRVPSAPFRSSASATSRSCWASTTGIWISVS